MMTGRGSRPETRAAWLFLLPAVGLISCFFFLPLLAGLLLSLTDFDIYSLGSAADTRFVAFRNYDQLLTNPVFWSAVRNTLIFALVGGPLTIVVSLAAALLLDAKLVRLRPLFRTIYFAPVVTTLVAVAVVWRYLYHPRVGILNLALASVGIEPIDWLGDPFWAMPAVILFALWKNFGTSTVIFLAGLQDVPAELHEAAEIDGAGPIRRFFHVTLPSLTPTFVLVTVLTMIGYFQLFAEVYVLTPDGGPLNSTISLVMLMYREGFRWWNMGSSAAVAFVLFVLVVSFGMLQRLIRWSLAR